jgi:hypothetical protein
MRRIYLAHARLFRMSPEPRDQALGAQVVAFVPAMPQPDSQRLAVARERPEPPRPDTRRDRHR